jgi:hypothetical protein
MVIAQLPAIGSKVLLSTNFFVAPDGLSYNAVWGTLSGIKSSEETLGVKTNAKSTNWYITIGGMIVAGCQVHYAINAPKCNFGRVVEWQCHEGLYRESEHPTRIYNADRVEA